MPSAAYGKGTHNARVAPDIESGAASGANESTSAPLRQPPKQPLPLLRRRPVLAALAAATVVAATGLVVGVLYAAGVLGGSAGGSVSLRASEGGVLTHAVSTAQVRRSGAARVLARAYDGLAWEAVPDTEFFPPAEVVCEGGGGSACSLRVPEGAGSVEYVEVKIEESVLRPGEDALAARLLAQGGFGASRGEIARVAREYADDWGRWVLEQMGGVRSSAREYKRRRTNPRPDAAAVLPPPATTPCDLDSRWAEYAFDQKDVGRSLRVDAEPGSAGSAGAATVLRATVDGAVRSVLAAGAFPGAVGAAHTICSLHEGVDSPVRVLPAGGDCADRDAAFLEFPNPRLALSADAAAALGASLQDVSATDASFAGVVGGHRGSRILTARSVPCTAVERAEGDAFLRYAGDTVLRFDKRVKWWTNTVEEPSFGGGGAADVCPLVHSSYLNRGSCVRRPSCSAGSSSYTPASVTLDEATLRAWNSDADATRVVYYMAGLRLEGASAVSFCATRFSRWLKRGAAPCASAAAFADSSTLATVTEALASSTDPNPFVRDIVLAASCNAADPATIGAQVEAAGSCWEHVHPDLYSVRDATLWVQEHDGNRVAMTGGAANPILKAAAAGGVELAYPASHPMSRWSLRRDRLHLVGRYGDTVTFDSLPINLQTEKMALRVGALAVESSSSGDTVACGSPNEVASVPALGHHYYTTLADSTADTNDLEFTTHRWDSHEHALINSIFHSSDQLAQRIAWALSNHFVVSQVDQNLRFHGDAFLSYWDSLTRHAFGNFLDIMRDVSWSPLMAKYLTYDRSRSLASSSRGSFPDENYARELMQLFTIGLWRMGDDGVEERDASGALVPTYSNEDIVDFARVWTGLRRTAGRLNLQDKPGDNYVDPCEIVPEWRDRFPKGKLDSGHLGDGYPLCDDLPPRPWLHPGAKFVLTGSSSIEGPDLDSANSSEPVGRRGRFTPPSDGSSALHSALCAPSSPGGPCTFPLTVTLDRILPCSGEQECNAHRVLAVAVVDPTTRKTQYYHYQEPPCVRLTFFDQGRMLYRSWSVKQCGNPATVRGIPACCRPDDLDRVRTSFGPECLFSNEAMTYDQAEARCAAQDLTLCTDPRGQLSWQESCAESGFGWTNVPCQVQIQVYEGGRISIVDPLSRSSMLELNSFNYFRARWENDRAPVAVGSACPVDAPCESITTVDTHSCVCNITVADSSPYASVSSVADASVDDIASTLFIGAPDPSHFDPGTYTSSDAGDIRVWLHSEDSESSLSDLTIIELPPGRSGRPRFLRNKISTVNVGSSYSFRNMPTFLPLLGWADGSRRDWDDNPAFWKDKVEVEVEALLEHLFEHNNTAPFVAKHMIRNMVTSNPSPRYVQAVATAFRTGEVAGRKFSGRYGDMGALAYALLTDQEARSPALLADQHAGMVMDPVVKVMLMLRSLEYKSYNGREIILDNLGDRIGAQIFESPTVFNFYSPTFQPDGSVADNGLYAPQAELLTTPNVIGFLNGAHSLIDGGLTPCYDGFGTWKHNTSRQCWPDPMINADGNLTYVPNSADPDEIIGDLSLILTGGRVLPESLTYKTLLSEYKRVLDADGETAARRQVIKILVGAPEFHTTTVSLPVSGTARVAAVPATSRGGEVKSIIFVNLMGGTDSYNMLVPRSGCKDRDLYKDYTEARTVAALTPSQLLSISVTGQPCTTFGVHSSLPNVKKLYDEGDLTWFANIGAMVEPLNIDEYKGGSKDTPPFLFAHNFMQSHMQEVHAKSTNPKGLLGRTADVLSTSNTPLNINSASINGPAKALEGKKSDYDIMRAGNNVQTLNQEDNIVPALNNITTAIPRSYVADGYMANLIGSLQSAKAQEQVLEGVTLETESWASSSLGRQFETAARVIKARALNGSERITVYTARGGFDTHGTVDLEELFGDVDTNFGMLVKELKAQGRWENTVIVAASEFGRTVRSNGEGTDHGWGGHAFIAGGAVKGGVLGKYPEQLTDGGTHVMDQYGRMLPSMPWEGMWKGILEWYGVPASDLDSIIPNLKNFEGSENIYSASDLFRA